MTSVTTTETKTTETTTTVVAFAASTSTTSINKQLVTFASNQLTSVSEKAVSAKVLDLNDYPCPLFSEDMEKAIGKAESAEAFLTELQAADGYIISLAEHNGNFAAAFKNLYDWTSRLERKMFGDKPMLLLSTSPGQFGGASVMQIAQTGFPRMGANIISQFSLPRFHEAFVDDTITDKTQYNDFLAALHAFQATFKATFQATARHNTDTKQ